MDARSSRSCSLVALASVLCLMLTTPAHAAWDRARADGANSGHVNVATAPAGRGSVTIPDIGTFAPGVAPVMAPDGTVYIGNEQGELLAFTADGQRLWSRELPRGQAIRASAAVGTDGTIYVVGVSTVRDHRGGETVIRHESTLHRFVPGGGWLGGTPFPELYGGLSGLTGRGRTTAPPNIWRAHGEEAVIVPAVYPAPGGYEVRLVAFSVGGAVLDHARVTYFSGDITTSTDWTCAIPPFGTLMCLLGLEWPGFSATLPPNEHQLSPGAEPPFPGVAVVDGAPWLIATDRLHDIAVFGFTPAQGFDEFSRTRDPDLFVRTGPTFLAEAHTAVAARDDDTGSYIVFGGPSRRNLPRFVAPAAVEAQPTRLPGDRLVLVQRYGGVLVLERAGRGYALERRIDLPGHSIASAAAARDHVFVATATGFYTYDIDDFRELSRVDWLGGGLWPPAIGPKGHVYAMAANILFVFPPPTLACRFCRDVARPPNRIGRGPGAG